MEGVMPKEKVSSDGSFQVEVGWGREGTVQVGVSVSDAADESLVRRLFGYDDALVAMGEGLLGSISIQPRAEAWAKATTAEEKRKISLETGRHLLDVIDEVSGSAVPGGYRGLWSNFDRNGCNNLIRVLRRGRDIAFGRDE